METSIMTGKENLAVPANLQGPEDLASLLQQGSKLIQTHQTKDLFKQLETRSLTEDEESVIQQRVALQRKMFAEYEKRDMARKVAEILSVCPSITEEEAAKALDMSNGREDQATDKLVSDPGFLRLVQLELAAPAGPAVRQSSGTTRTRKASANKNYWAAQPGAAPSAVDSSSLGDAVFVAEMAAQGEKILVSTGLLGPEESRQVAEKELVPSGLVGTGGAAGDAAAADPSQDKGTLCSGEHGPESLPDVPAGGSGSKTAAEATAAAPGVPSSQSPSDKLPVKGKRSKRSRAVASKGAPARGGGTAARQRSMKDMFDAQPSKAQAPSEVCPEPMAAGRPSHCNLSCGPNGDPAKEEAFCHPCSLSLCKGDDVEQGAVPSPSGTAPATSPSFAGMPVVQDEPGSDSTPADAEQPELESASFTPAASVAELINGSRNTKKASGDAPRDVPDQGPEGVAAEDASGRPGGRSPGSAEMGGPGGTTKQESLESADMPAAKFNPSPANDSSQQFAAACPVPSPEAEGSESEPQKAKGGGRRHAISRNGHTVRGRVRQKGSRQAELLEAGSLREDKGWYNSGYIFPDGFKSRVLFRSSVALERTCLHECFVLGKAGAYFPLPTFKVVALDRPEEPVIAKSCTGCWTQIQKRINSVIEARRKAGEDLPPPPKTAIAGPEFFGFNQPEIEAAIEALDPEHKAAEFWHGKEDRDAARQGRAPPSAAAAPGSGSAPCAGPRKARKPRKPRGARAGSDDDDDEEEMVAAGGGEEDDETTNMTNKWSAVSRSERYKKRCIADGDEAGLVDDSNPLPGFIDPITLEPVIAPAISPYGHVMGMATWKAVLAEQRICPFTKSPLSWEQCTTLTKHNIERFRDRIKL
ncbi:hypothetical protein WJX84_011650 [Apatococcus fuscideae]|uniref:U-box domain-containing protein n=1 Tax=Apatococcus fuscideae TaxID=2026836 RepID=A0AAW1SUS0_9CHLO